MTQRPDGPGRPAPQARFALMLAVLALSGCVLGQPYHAPTMALPDRYARLAPLPVVPAEQQVWWRFFGDPVLDRLVARGLANNVSLAQARARVAEAEAQARGAGNPASGTLSISRQFGNGYAVDQNMSAIALNLSPGARAQARAAMERLQAAGYGAENARIQLLQALTGAYVDLRYYQASLALKREDLASRRRTLQGIETLLQAGFSTKLDKIRAEALVAQTETEIPQLNASVARQSAKIATLLGVPAGALDIDLRYAGRQPLPSGRAALGVPADLVRRRPDIRAAERQYAAAVSDVSTAEAARFPSLSLSGQIVAPLDGALSGARTLSAGLVLPLFDQPGLAAAADAARARADQAYQTWRLAVLNAVEQVETALAAVSGSRQAAAMAARVVALNTEALSLSRSLLASHGDITVLDLLDRERAISDARDSLAQTRRAYATDFISLHAALGLGAGTFAQTQGQPQK